MYLMPKEGLRVCFPGRPSVALPPEGAEVDDHDSYWLRRLADGDVVRIEPQATTTATADHTSAPRARARRGETEE